MATRDIPTAIGTDQSRTTPQARHQQAETGAHDEEIPAGADLLAHRRPGCPRNTRTVLRHGTVRRQAEVGCQ